ncbi:hypothetical protein [Clostridium sp. JN-1]|uniref:hypothetical protein n=1 Tax=Clostridium sp. JN-1 TaxID=2483110 RepID=UPI000F0BC707|nr:hypothetical protein [Clostridium sp. JN-1]
MRWDETRKQRIRNQLIRKVTPFMKEVKVLRQGENIFGEKQEDQFVCKVKGYYHAGGTSINVVNYSIDAANLNRNYQDRFLIVVDDEVRKIKEHDYFDLSGIKYEIVDKGNIEDIIYDSYLKRLE